MFRDRRDAGRRLAALLSGYKGKDAIVLALPRGGVPVGFEVAQALDLPLDVLVVRKLGAPANPELAMGAIGVGVRVLNPRVVAGMDIDPEDIEDVARQEQAELERRQDMYRGDQPAPEMEGRIVILVDDGIATGSTAQAAVQVLREAGAAQVVLAVPVLPDRAAASLSQQVDDLHYVLAPSDFYAVGQFYEDFSQTQDDEVQRLLSVAEATA